MPTEMPELSVGAAGRSKRMPEGFKIRHLDIRTEYPAPAYKPIKLPAGCWKNGMIVRMPNHLGDSVMALPALEALRKIVPENYALYVLAPANLRKMFLSLPFVDGFIGLKKPHQWWSKKELAAVRKKRFGAAVMFNRSFRDTVMLRLAGVDHVYGLPGNAFRGLFLSANFRKAPGQGNASGHLTRQYLAMATALGAPEWNGDLPPFKLITAPDENRPPVNALCAHPQLLVICPGAAYGSAKRWSELGFRAVSSFWIDRGGVVAVVGGGSEREVGERIAKGLWPEKIFNLCGKTDLDELMWLLKSAMITLANDSGVMHLGAALGGSGLTVFGPTDYTATGPISANWSLLSDFPACAPCFSHDCPSNGHVCMKAVSSEQVKNEIIAILAKRNIRLSAPQNADSGE